MALNELRHETTAATTSGTIEAGAIAAGFQISSGGSATVGNITLHASGVTVMNFPELTRGVYGEISYTVSSGTLNILEVRE